MAQVYESSFQITLPSNASQANFASNRANSFKTKISKPLQLDGEWEVSLVDIQFPSSYANLLDTMVGAVLITGPLAGGVRKKLTPAQNDISNYPFAKADKLDEKVDRLIAARNLQETPLLYTRIIIRKGHFDSVMELGYNFAKLVSDSVNRNRLLPYEFSLRYEKDPKSKRNSFQVYYQEEIDFTFCTLSSTFFKSVFALSPTSVFQPDPDEPPLNLFSFKFSSFGSGKLDYVSSMYVYSDLIKYQLVGDTEAPLLGIVPLTNEGSGAQEYYSFNPPYYIPLAKSYFDTIEIQINTDWGDPFPFTDLQNGKVACRLHFRRKPSQFL